jgi:Family of unknown function (DUF6644)
MLELFEWIQATGVSVAIRESTLMFPIIEGTHVLALAFSVGTIVALDLRLVGWGMKKTPVSVIFEQLRPWSLLGFVIMFLTGFLLFWSEPVKCATTPAFIIKMVLLAGTGLNALVFDRQIYPSVAGWDNTLKVPGRARFAGYVSMILWFGVIFAGRWTAYF